jgi:hypothetical protein
MRRQAFASSRYDFTAYFNSDLRFCAELMEPADRRGVGGEKNRLNFDLDQRAPPIGL